MNEISRRLGVSKPTIIAWLKKEDYAEGRGWKEGAYRTHSGDEVTRIVELKKKRISEKSYTLGSPVIRMDYHKKFQSSVKLYPLREPFLNRSPDRTPPLLSGEMVAGCGMRSRPRGGGVWGGIRAGFGFLF